MRRLRNLGRVVSAGLLATGILAQPPNAPAHEGQSTKVDFVHDVQPILKAHCYQCHGAVGPSASLNLTSREGILKGGASGSAVVPGKSGDSLLVTRILGLGGGDRMPLGFAPLSNKDSDTIRRWIDQGATAGGTSAPQRHWAFVPPVRPILPKVKDRAWVTNPIDSFVLSRLESEGLRPSPAADKTTLVRRLSLDLIGLPPTPAEVDAFLADMSPNAYERVVDRLLANPHFGERMALPWLDAARYADSNGFQQDGDNHQFVWRDWVVDALNADMPFDEFTTEQLAGDLLPNPTPSQIVATAFNRNHMLNGEGGAIPEEQRNVVLFDRVDVTSTTWMGLTLACARCHDHKYDPFTQTDYYQLLAFFNNVPESGVPPGGGQYRIADPWVYAGSQEQMSQFKALKYKVAAAEADLHRIKASRETRSAFAEWKARTLVEVHRAYDARIYIESWYVSPPFSAKSFDEAFDTSYPPEKGEWTGEKERTDWVDGKTYQISGDNTAVYLRRTIHIGADAKVMLSIGSDDGVKVWLNGKPILSHKVTRGVVPDDEKIILSLTEKDNDFVMKIVNGGGIGGFYFNLVPGGIPVDVLGAMFTDTYSAKQKVLDYYFETAPPKSVMDAKSKLKEAKEALEKLRTELPQVMVMSDRQPRKTYVLSRGNYEVPLDEVKCGTPSAIAPMPTGAPPNRLGLAKWIVSPQNPLTSRVEVNRVWQMLFGRGLVRTPENFGLQGERPTHPELLDWLSVDFRESGWKVKRLIKMILMSSTYRQSSQVSKALYDRDPDNRLLARGARFRMSSLILRDVALATSGLLNPRIGGKPVYPYQPKGIWDGLAITNERDFTYPESKGSDLYRRSIYTFWRRTVAPGNMFDTSVRQACTVRASMTSTPLHALTTLNDVTWVESGRALAESLLKATSSSMEDRISEGFRRVCARRPSPEELKVLVQAFKRSLAAYQSDPSQAQAYLSTGASPVDKTLDPPTLASLANVCLAIYNLDEALTRE